MREALRPRYAPSLLSVEVANALRRYVVKGDLEAGLAMDAVDVIPHIISLVDHRSLLEEATMLAIRRNHSVHDCLYVVTALRRGLPLVTADLKLARKFEGLDQLSIRLVGGEDA